MAIVLVGLSHRTAPVEIREQLALSGSALQNALEALHRASNDPLHECVILSTCNRMEVYMVGGSTPAAWDCIEQFLSAFHGVPRAQIHPHLYFSEGDAAVSHLMHVACGLDSMILGEAQILGQLTQAFDAAHAALTTGALLSRLFTQAIHAGKRARTETGISHHSTSVSHTAVQLVQRQIADLETCRVLVIGAGEMAVLAAQAMQRSGAKTFRFINRTYTNAETMANQFGGEALRWSDLHEALLWADVVFSATGAPHVVVYAEDVEKLLPRREGRVLLFMDIAVPRDIDEAVDDLPAVFRYDVDGLQSAVDQHREQRLAAVPQVESIIQHELNAFDEWLNSRQVSQVIAELQQWARMIAQKEVTEALNRLKNSEQDVEQVVNRLAHRLTSKLLHEPTTRLKTQAARGRGYPYAVAMCELFGLEKDQQMRCGGESADCDHESHHTNGAATACNLQCLTR